MIAGPFRVVLHPRAARELSRLQKHVRRRMYAAFEALEQDPFRPRPGADIRVLKGYEGVRAVRVGDYHAVCAVTGAEVFVTKVGRRSPVYSP